MPTTADVKIVVKIVPRVPKLFSCKCGWLLGESYRDAGKRVTQLRVYRSPRAPEQGADLRNIPAFQKFVVTELNDGFVLCGHCGARVGWYANQGAISEMLERRSVRREGKG